MKLSGQESLWGRLVSFSFIGLFVLQLVFLASGSLHYSPSLEGRNIEERNLDGRNPSGGNFISSILGREGEAGGIGRDESIRVLVGFSDEPKFSIKDLVIKPSKEQFRQRNRQNLIKSVSRDVAQKKIKIVRDFKSAPAVAMEVTSEGLRSLLQNPEVKSVAQDRIFSITLADSAPYLNASAAWDLGFTGAGQAVCILDTGIDYGHPSLGNCSNSSFLSGACEKVPSGFDFVNNDDNPIDDHGHGTHVAGIVSARPFEFCGAECRNYSGIAPDAKVVAIKVCDKSGRCSESNIIAGIEWCTANAAQFNISVISMSLGAGQYDSEEVCVNNHPFINDAVNAAAGEDIFVLGASGNVDGSEDVSAGILSPACLPNVSSVGSINLDNTLSSFSFRGRLLDFLAPGNGIRSATINGGSTRLSGTSMATPHVAGAVALLKGATASVGAKASAAEIKMLLNATGVMIEDSVSGMAFPRIDIGKAMASAVGTKMNLTIALKKGWDGISFPLFSDEGNISKMFRQLGDDFLLLYFNSTDARWQSFDGKFPEAAALHGIFPGMGLWIHLPQDMNLSFEGIVPARGFLRLEKGWNLIGWPVGESKKISGLAWLGNISKIFSLVEGGLWQSYEAGRNNLLNTLEYFNATRVYWVKSNAKAEISLSS